MNFSKLIFNADDLGMSARIDREILSVAERGLVQSASVSVVNGVDHNRFKTYLKLEQTLQLGLHINLTEGRPLSSALDIKTLINDRGIFRSAVELLSEEENLCEETLFSEMKVQLERFIQLAGKKPNHIDSHQHYTYLSPIAFRAFLRLAADENLQIRTPLPFLQENRLQHFVESVRRRHGVQIPFLSSKRSQELREAFTTSPAEVRTEDCVTEIPAKNDLEDRLRMMSTVEVVCHPHDPADLERLRVFYK